MPSPSSSPLPLLFSELAKHLLPARSTRSSTAASFGASPLAPPSRHGPFHDPCHSDATAHAAAAREPRRARNAHAPAPAAPRYPAKSQDLRRILRPVAPQPESSTHPWLCLFLETHDSTAAASYRPPAEHPRRRSAARPAGLRSKTAQAHSSTAPRRATHPHPQPDLVEPQA